MKQLFFWALLFLVGCHSSSKTTNLENDTITFTPKIVFLNYTIFNDTDGEINARFENKIIVDGQFKKNNEETTNNLKDKLLFIQQNNKGVSLDTTTVNNPLYKNIEYVSDDQRLAQKKVQLDSAQLSVRMQLHQNCKSVAVVCNDKKIAITQL